jgi:hypothetical protein
VLQRPLEPKGQFAAAIGRIDAANGLIDGRRTGPGGVNDLTSSGREKRPRIRGHCPSRNCPHVRGQSV